MELTFIKKLLERLWRLNPPEASIPAGELARLFRAHALDSLKVASLAFGLFGLGAAAFHLAHGLGSAAPQVVWADLLAGLVSLGIFMAIQKGWLGVAAANAGGLAILVGYQINVAWHVAAIPGFVPFFQFLIMAAAAGFFFLQLRWLAAGMATLLLFGWEVQRLAQGGDTRLTPLNVAAALILALMIHRVRARMVARLEGLRWRDGLRARQLEEAMEKLRQAKEQAEEATRLKDQFVMLVAHDLKSPLYSMSTQLALLDEAATTKPAQAAEIRQGLRERLSHLVRTIDGLLNITRLQTGKIRPESGFIKAFQLTSRLVVLKDQAADKGIELVNLIPDGYRLFGDAALLGEVLVNLVSNAIKFCRPGDKVALYVHPQSPSTLVVADTGPGIRPDLLPGLFDHTQKISTSGTQGESGTGLGLPLSKDIMTAHGGQLRVESIPGLGAVFFMELPHHRPRVVLVMEPGGPKQELLRRLEEERVEVIQAADCKEALAAAIQMAPQLIVSCKLPEEGKALTQHPPFNGGGPYLPLLLLLDRQQEREVLARKELQGWAFTLPRESSPERIMEEVVRFLGEGVAREATPITAQRAPGAPTPLLRPPPDRR